LPILETTKEKPTKTGKPPHSRFQPKNKDLLKNYAMHEKKNSDENMLAS